MKTNAVPAVIMLTAGFIDCILSLYEHVSMFVFTKRLLIVLVIFYVLGCIVKIVLDCNFKEMEETEESEGAEESEEKELEDAPAEEDILAEEVQEPEISDEEDSDNMDPDRADT